MASTTNMLQHTQLLHHLHNLSSSSPKLNHLPNARRMRSNSSCYRGIRVFRSGYGGRDGVVYCCLCKTNSEIENVSVQEDKMDKKEEETVKKQQRPPFDINLAVILAGFAFEAYTTPPVIFLFI